jgi:DNA polymerase elongation subunit (family B)
MPIILHGIFFKHDLYLEQAITRALVERAELKKQLKSPNISEREKKIIESKSIELKLQVNGCYGYTLTRLNDPLSSFTEEKMVLKRNMPRLIANKSTVISNITPFGNSHMLVTKKKVDLSKSISTPLLAIGASILGNSKVLLLKNVNFLLHCLDPRMAEALYFDTDSVFFALKYPKLEDNVCKELLPYFIKNKNIFIDNPNKPSGFLVLEKMAHTGHFYGEKMYILSSNDDDKVEYGLKGISKSNIESILKNKTCLYPVNRHSVTSTNMSRRKDMPMLITEKTKTFVKAVIPSKRYFMGQHSVPFYY